jgi:hypothetical protein
VHASASPLQNAVVVLLLLSLLLQSDEHAGSRCVSQKISYLRGVWMENNRSGVGRYRTEVLD